MGLYLSKYFNQNIPKKIEKKKHFELLINEKRHILENNCYKTNYNNFCCAFCLKKCHYYHKCVSCLNKPNLPLCEECFLVHNYYHDQDIKSNSFMGSSKDRKFINEIGSIF